MSAADTPTEEEQRREFVAAMGVLDTPRDTMFDRFVFTAAQLFRTPIATLTIEYGDRHWMKAKVGLRCSELPRSHSLCSHTIATRDVMMVPDARADARFADNPIVIGEPRVRFYAGAPLITPNNTVVGALCVVDTHPRSFSPAQLGQLAELARGATDLLMACYPVDVDLGATANEREPDDRGGSER